MVQPSRLTLSPPKGAHRLTDRVDRGSTAAFPSGDVASDGGQGLQRRDALVVVPTYNERNCLEQAVTAAVERGFDVLVIDDSSPDGTADLADALASRFEGVTVMRRPRKLGLGSAYVTGFRFGLARGYRFVLEMDADGSHAPDQLPKLVDAGESVGGLAIGSRYVRGGGSVGWDFRRRLLSRLANSFCRVALGHEIHDWTSGYRCYGASALRLLISHPVASNGFAIQIELASRCVRQHVPVVEIPICFRDRSSGESKASISEVARALGCVVRLS